MRVLARRSEVFGPCCWQGWNQSRPQQDWSCWKLEKTRDANRDQTVPRISRLLQTIHRELLQDCTTTHIADAQRPKFRLGRETRWSIPGIEGEVVQCTSFKSSRRIWWFHCVLRHIRSGFRLCVDAARQGYCLCLQTTEDSWEELYDSWFGAGSYRIRTQMLETLLVWN